MPCETTPSIPYMTHGLNLTHRTGVYSIINLVNQKLYIGSAARSFMSRWSLHRVRLRDNQHNSPHLQAAWNKYGAEAFEFGVVEDCAPEKCIELEQFWMDFFQPEYNILKKAGSLLGRKMSAETKARMSASRKGKKMSEEARANMRKAQKNRKPITEETRKRMSIANSGRVYSPEEIERRKEQAKKNLSGYSRKGSKLTPEHRKAISVANKGKKISPESIEKWKKSRAGFKHTPESIEKMKASHDGQGHTEETKLKISETMKAKGLNPQMWKKEKS